MDQFAAEPEAIGSGFLPSPEYGPLDAYLPLPTPSRRLSEGESNSNARKDYRYQVGPGPDKKYHCPFEAKGCTHKPDKLKCNYE